MKRERRGSRCPTSVKVQLVLRLLGGETIEDLARETGRSKHQLRVWLDRFLAGGEAHLESSSQGNRSKESAAHQEGQPAGGAVGTGEACRGLADVLKGRDLSDIRSIEAHPYCSPDYLRATEEPGLESRHLPAWDAYVLIRRGRMGVHQATGVRPVASLKPTCDLHGGLNALRETDVASVALVTDPMWCPDVAVLQRSFDVCRPLGDYYVVDRESTVRFGKRHRNRINRARSVSHIESISLSDHMGQWLELYQRNVEARRISHPCSPRFFERLATMPWLSTVVARVDEEIVSITLWIRHSDTLYFHESASSQEGYEVSSTYAIFADVIENTACRYVALGGSPSLRQNSLDGVGMFKRGFSNCCLHSYLCQVSLIPQLSSRSK
jgi:hypothetical protein